jgi:hypothetical protein
LLYFREEDARFFFGRGYYGPWHALGGPASFTGRSLFDYDFPSSSMLCEAHLGAVPDSPLAPRACRNGFDQHARLEYEPSHSATWDVGAPSSRPAWHLPVDNGRRQTCPNPPARFSF